MFDTALTLFFVLCAYEAFRMAVFYFVKREMDRKKAKRVKTMDAGIMNLIRSIQESKLQSKEKEAMPKA